VPACEPFIFGQITLKNTLKKILSAINLLVWVANPRELLLNYWDSFLLILITAMKILTILQGLIDKNPLTEADLEELLAIESLS
jgi:D-glycerate 3-kinase